MEHLPLIDLVKRYVIIAMFSDDELVERLVLKGGNLLDIGYNLTSRASLDVDLSMDGEFDDVDRLNSKLFSVLAKTFSEIGYVMFDYQFSSEPPRMTADLQMFWGGYRIRFKLVDSENNSKFRHDIDQLRRNAAPIGKNGSTRFKIDISKHEFCDGKQVFLVDDYEIYGYSPKMFVSEKLRAICQQMPEYVQIVKSHPSSRARDFVDIHSVAEYYHVDFSDSEFHSIVRSMFEIKRVPLKLIQKVRDTRDQHVDDFLAVKDTVRPGFDLKDFDFYFDYVCGACGLLEPLWDE